MAAKFVRVKSKGGPDLEYSVSEIAFKAHPERYVAVGDEQKPPREEPIQSSGETEKEETQ